METTTAGEGAWTSPPSSRSTRYAIDFNAVMAILPNGDHVIVLPGDAEPVLELTRAVHRGVDASSIDFDAIARGSQPVGFCRVRIAAIAKGDLAADLISDLRATAGRRSVEAALLHRQLSVVGLDGSLDNGHGGMPPGKMCAASS
jgi:hypothetical protein